MKIVVNIEKKYALMIVGTILILAIGLGVWAYNSGDWQANPGTASIMGHSADEVDLVFNGDVMSLQNFTDNYLDQHINDLANAAIGQTTATPSTCVQIYDSYTTAVTNLGVKNKPGWQKTNIPSAIWSNCTTGSGCTIKQEIYNQNGLEYLRRYTYLQDPSTGRWTSSSNPKGGNNGDQTATPIILAFNYLELDDDYKGSNGAGGTLIEEYSDQWSARDATGSYGQIISICY